MWSGIKALFGYERDQIEVEIETVTTSTFSQLDQAACLEICDHIKQRNDGPSIAMSTLLNQLEKSAATDKKTASFTLNLLDMCVKNCGRRFISELCKEDYLKRFQKLIVRGKVADAIQTRLLTLIKTWKLGFSDYEEFHPIYLLYNALHRSGVLFPDIKEDDVYLLKRTLQPSRTSEVSGITQEPTASNTRTTELMKAIRHDLDQAALDLPAFEAQVQSLACTPPDDVTLRQLHATAERLGGLQGRLKAYVGPLSESMNSPLGSTKEKEAALDELMQVNEKICRNILEFQSFERMCRREEERAAARTLGVTSSEAVENPPEVPTTSLAVSSVATAAEAPAATKTSAAGTELTEKNDILQTLSYAREAIQLFQTLHQEIGTSQVVDASQMRDLRVVVERLEGLQKKINALIYRSTTANSAELTNEADTTLGNLTSMNDELLSCIRLYQMAIRKHESGGSPEPERKPAYDYTPDKNTVSTWSQASGPESAANAASSSFCGPASIAPSASSESQVKAQLTPPGIFEAPEVAQKPAAPDARTTQLLQAIRQNLDLVALDLPVFESMVQGLACTPPDDVTLRELHATADRLQDLQRRLEANIESLTDPKLESSRGKEATLDELMRVNEKINVDIQQFQSFEKMRLGQEEETPVRTSAATKPERPAATTAVATPPGARNPLSTEATTAAAPTTAMFTADASEVSRVIIQTTLSQAAKHIQQFKALQESLKTSAAQMNDVAQMRELRTVGERLEEVQKEVHGLINEKLHDISDDVTEKDENILASLTEVNDELLLCIENQRRTVREYESGLALRPEQSTVQDPATGTGAVPTWGQSVSTGLHSDPVPEIKTALDSTAVTGHMPANSQFVSQGPQFKTEPGPGTGYEKTTVVPPTSADSQLKSQSGTDHFPGSTTAFGTETVTGDMPANSQFVSQGPQFGTEPGLRTGNKKTSVGSPTSADYQVQSQSETDKFPGLTTAFGSASIADHMPENSQFVPQEPLFGTEPGQHTGNEKTSVVPPISADVEMDIQDSEVSQHHGVAQHAFEEALTEQPMAALQMATSHALAGVKARVQSLSDLLKHVKTSGTPMPNRDALQMKNLCTEIDADLQKLLDLRNNYERMKIQQEPSLGAGGPADVDPLLLELYTVPAEACGVLADYEAFLNAGAKVCQDGDCDSATDG